MVKPAADQVKSANTAIDSVISPRPVTGPFSSSANNSSPVSTAQTFATNPFSTTLQVRDFSENANRIDADRADRVASAQRDYDARSLARARAAQEASMVGSAKGKRMFFDPRMGIAKSMQRADGGIANLSESKYYPRKTGHISGPGTETSDSIPAMLSDGEFVMTAKAVKALGKGNRRAGAKKMYALMHQLERNASRG